MSLTIFLALGILGCDVLIYFLYEWAFGESNRIRRRRAASRLRADTAAGNQGYVSRAGGRSAVKPPVIMLQRKSIKPASASALPSPQDERLAYRRVATSFAQLKPRT